MLHVFSIFTSFSGGPFCHTNPHGNEQCASRLKSNKNPHLEDGEVTVTQSKQLWHTNSV